MPNDSADTWRDIRQALETGDLTLAEEKLLNDLPTGQEVVIGDGRLPSDAMHPFEGSSRIIRADLIRFLLLGGDERYRPHEKGLMIIGARVMGELDLQGCRIPRDIFIVNSRFEEVPNLRSAVIDGLFLEGSALPGLRADRLEARAGAFSMWGASPG